MNKIPEVSFFAFLKRALEIVKNPLPFHHYNFERYGDTFQLHLGFGKRIVFSKNVTFLKYALQTNQRNFTKSPVQTRDVAKYLGKGLLTSEGELWKKQRKLIQPTFHKKHLAKLLHIMRSTIQEELSKLPLNSVVDVEPYFGKLAFQVVAKSLFSGAVKEEVITNLQHTVEAAQRMLVRELRQPYLVWWFKASGLLQKHYTLVHNARNLIREIIYQRKNEVGKYNDLLDLLLSAQYEDGSYMEEEQMIDEILILFTAGHETTSNALTFTCQLLAKHPEYQEEIRVENKAEYEGDILTELMQHKITKQVLEESMRLYPPAYFIDRMNITDDEFEGIPIPKKTAILFSVIEIHRHKSLWENPLEFKPKRFSGPANQYSSFYFPFGAGPRMCIGNNFAMFEMQLVISELLKNLKILPNKNPIGLTPLITLKPKDAKLEFQTI